MPAKSLWNNLSLAIMKNLSVFASGGGSNLQSIIDAIERGELKAKISFVVSNNSDAFALTRARNHGIPTFHISAKTHPCPEQYTDELIRLHEANGVELILLAGYMKILPSALVKLYKGKILNIHPALLPKYGGKGMYGINVHKAVIAAREKESGATVHWVTDVYDEGPVLMQSRVPVLEGDTAEILARRVLDAEHKLYPQAVNRALYGT